MDSQGNKGPALIDIDNVLKTRAPKIYRMLPQFLVNYVKRVIHQKGINKYLTEAEDKMGSEFINGGLDYLNVKYEVYGAENVPKDGRYIFASNHPLGGLDGMVLIKALEDRFGPVKAIINDLLMNLHNLRPVFLGVNLYGSKSKDSVQYIKDTFDSDINLMIFPAGVCSRKIKGKVVDLEWKKTFIARAMQHKRDIVPIYTEGRNSNFFYRLSKFRKFIGIKSSFEMIYLPDEMFKQAGSTIRVYIGKPIPYQLFDENRKDRALAEKVKQHVYKLKDDTRTEFML